MAPITVITNQKGGVGKTTTAVCLGAALAKRGKKTLLIDLDPEAHLSLWLSQRLAGGDPSTLDLLVGKGDARDLARPVRTPDGTKDLPNLFVIPAAPDLFGVDIKLADELGRELMLRKRLAPLRPLFDAILIDCPPALGILTANALTAADWVLIPLQLSVMSLNGLVSIKNTIDVITERLNPGLKVLGVVPCMLDRRANLGPAILQQLREKAPYPVLETAIRHNVRLAEAPSFGLPIEDYEPESTGAEDYRKLAEEFTDRLEREKGGSDEKKSDQPEPARLVG